MVAWLSSLLEQAGRQRDGKAPTDHPCQAALHTPAGLTDLCPDQNTFLHTGHKFHLPCAVGAVWTVVSVCDFFGNSYRQGGNDKKAPLSKNQDLCPSWSIQRGLPAGPLATTCHLGNKSIMTSHVPCCKISEKTSPRLVTILKIMHTPQGKK